MRTVVSLLLILISLGVILFPLKIVAVNQETSPSSKLVEVTRVADLKDRIWERITLFLKFSQKDKINYQQQLAEKRLAELKYVIDSDRGDMIEETSSRYSAYLGRLTEAVLQNKITNKKQELLSMFENHAEILDELIGKVNVDSGFWLLLKHDINYVKIYSDQIKSL